MTHRTAAADNLRGILAMVAAVGFFSLMDALLKTLSAHYPPLQVAALRGCSALPLVVLYVLWRREAGGLLRVRWPLHLLRGVLNVAMLALFTYALKLLGLAEAYTLFFIAPLLITALSTVVLGERCAPRTGWPLPWAWWAWWWRCGPARRPSSAWARWPCWARPPAMPCRPSPGGC